MEKPNISTIIAIICILIIGLYAAGEVNYYSHKIITEKNITSTVIVIEKVGITEKMVSMRLTRIRKQMREYLVKREVLA